jgi:hypothetical protein
MKTHGITRRRFLDQTAAVLAAGTFAPLERSLAVVGNESRRAATLEEAYKRLGFDARAADSFTSLWMADIHYGGGKPEDILPPMLAEIAPMNPRPAFIGIVGDLICAASRAFGIVPNEADRRTAVEEFRAMKPHYEELARLAPVKLTLGNHDTFPGEANLGLFRSVYGDTPVTHAFETKGVPFIIANGGSCGLLDDAQQTWFCEQVKRLHRPGGTLITAVHQPSVGNLVRERGITSAARAAFAGARGKIWLIGGHEHENRDRQFSIPGGESVMNAWITAGNRTSWGKENPGYWVWCFAAGRLVGRIFRHVGDPEGYRLSAPEVAERAEPLLLPFENRDDLLWKVLVGEGDEPYRRTTQAAWCLNYWTYVRKLDYEFPLQLAKGKARRCVVLMASISSKPTGLSVSADAKDWQAVENPEQNGSYLTFTIPQACLDSGSLSLRMTDCAVSGFGLLG